MKNIYKIAGLACALTFVACGGESGTSANDDQSSDSVGLSSSPVSTVSSSSVTTGAKSSSSVAGNQGNDGTSSATSSTGSSAEDTAGSIIIPGATITDARDGQTYKVYKNATQYWIAENMRYDAKPNGCYNDAPDNCTKFGLWYTWDAAQTVCPEGWRLPYGKEWRTLEKLNSNKSLMNGGKVLFNTEKFYARLTGGYFVTSDGSKWSGANSYAYYWNIEDLSSKEGGHASLSSTGGLSVDVDPDDNYIVDKSSLLTVRCILESHGTMVDPRDGQTYKTIRLGDNVWMAENLNYDIAGSVARDDAPNDGLKYGRYYSKASAKIACPSGWHLSTASDWKPIYDIVDSVVLDGISLKSMEGWDESHLGQDDFEMNIVPAGDCFYSTIDKVVNCSVTGENARFWVEGGSTYYQNENSLGMRKGDDTDYLSVRCVKN